MCVPANKRATAFPPANRRCEGPAAATTYPNAACGMLTRRAVCTDHGAFVVINVYCPNAGPAPERPRLAIKMRFLEALKRKADALASAGREARRLPAERRCAHGL